MTEDIIIDGIGKLLEINQLSTTQIEKKLDPSRFILLTAISRVPASWPKELMENLTQTRNGNTKRLNKWYMNLDGLQWKLFYTFDLDAYLDEMHLVPAFIYAKSITEQIVSYRPLVSMLIQEDGKIQQASNSWCNKVISAALYPYPPTCVLNQQLKLPD